MDVEAWQASNLLASQARIGLVTPSLATEWHGYEWTDAAGHCGGKCMQTHGSSNRVAYLPDRGVGVDADEPVAAHDGRAGGEDGTDPG